MLILRRVRTKEALEQQRALRENLLREQGSEYAQKKKGILKSLVLDASAIERYTRLDNKIHERIHDEVGEVDHYFSGASSDEEETGELHSDDELKKSLRYSKITFQENSDDDGDDENNSDISS